LFFLSVTRERVMTYGTMRRVLLSATRGVVAGVVLNAGGPAYAQAAEPAESALPTEAQASPPGVPRARATRLLEFEGPVPQGYQVVTRIQTGWVVRGAVTLGSTWLLNVLIATVTASNQQTLFIPLFAPVVGPFIAIGTASQYFNVCIDPRSVLCSSSLAVGIAAVVFGLDGLVQALGAAMLIYGLAAPTRQLVLNQHASVVFPMPLSFGAGSIGLGVAGTFDDS
jgi:hypothetical protein